MDLSYYSTRNSKCATKIILKWFALIKTNISAAQNGIFLKNTRLWAIYTKVIAVYNIGLLDKSDLCGYHRKQQAVLSFSVCKIEK
jgi:hypothetical protein